MTGLSPAGRQPRSPGGVLIYLCYGREDIFAQTLYSILSLMHVCGPEISDFKVVVYTDAPARFAGLPVTTIPLDAELLEQWLDGSDYIHRRKTCVILDALDRFARPVAFIDADSWFRTTPARIFARTGPGRACFHICEGLLGHTGTVFDQALDEQLARHDLRLSNGEPVKGGRARMWNTGVVAIDPADRDLLTEALQLSDAIWATADPAGAYGKKIHHAEQFATGYAFRNCRLSEAADCLFHYWPASTKEVFGQELPALVATGLADPSPATLARIYARRPRETGLRGWVDTIKMALRRVTLRAGIPVRGVRRSVR